MKEPPKARESKVKPLNGVSSTRRPRKYASVSSVKKAIRSMEKGTLRGTQTFTMKDGAVIELSPMSNTFNGKRAVSISQRGGNERYNF